MAVRQGLGVLVALVALACSSCGYALAGRGSFLPAYIQTIGIPQFINTTPVYELEHVFTERVRTEFINRGNYKVQPNSTGVDALLTGEILSIHIQPASFTDEQQASRYILTVTAKIEFRDLKTKTCCGRTRSGSIATSTKRPPAPTRSTRTRFSRRAATRSNGSARSSRRPSCARSWKRSSPVARHGRYNHDDSILDGTKSDCSRMCWRPARFIVASRHRLVVVVIA